MIHSLSGRLAFKKENYAIIETGGVGFKVSIGLNVAQSLPQVGEEIKLFTYLYVREDAMELYGFSNTGDLELFEKLNSVSGIGPKTALGILGVAKSDQLLVAINEGRTELLTKVSGIGKKTAERIILELKGKLSAPASEKTISKMESDLDLEEALIGLGYTRQQAKAAIEKTGLEGDNFEQRLKGVLKNIK